LTLWHVVKMQGLSDAEASEECDPSNDRATRITLKDLDTGEIAVVETCWRWTNSVCDNLMTLGVTYTPNDWTDECTG